MRRFLIVLIVIAGLLAIAAVLLSAADIPRATLEARYATPPSQFAELSYHGTSARAHYRIRGSQDAPVLLLLHGSNASLFPWEPWARRLSDRFKVVSVDLTGPGLTGPGP